MIDKQMLSEYVESLMYKFWDMDRKHLSATIESMCKTYISDRGSVLNSIGATVVKDHYFIVGFKIDGERFFSYGSILARDGKIADKESIRRFIQKEIDIVMSDIE